MKHCYVLSLLLGLCWCITVTAAESKTPATAMPAEPLAAELELFRPYLNKVWRADIRSSNGKPQVDYAVWQRILNGQAIKSVHSINDGEYGGETIIFWDKSKKSLAYYYFTTAGFYTHGLMQFDANTGKLTALENVENNANGITAVRSSSTLSLTELAVQSEYLQHEKWVAGHSAVYKPAPEGKVRFQ